MSQPKAVEPPPRDTSNGYCLPDENGYIECPHCRKAGKMKAEEINDLTLERDALKIRQRELSWALIHLRDALDPSTSPHHPKCQGCSEALHMVTIAEHYQ